MVTATLDGMAAGGMYDVVGGGFHRYSVDERWLVPALREDALRQRRAGVHVPARVGRHRADALPRGGRGDARLRPSGAGAPGRRARLGAGRRHRRCRGARPTRGRSTRRPQSGLPRDVLEPFEHGRFIVRGELEPDLRARVLAERATRPQPFRDDKALASWNGLALAALAEAAYRLERDDWLEAARGVGEFLLGPLSGEDAAIAALAPGRSRERRRIPRRLRERRVRPHGAARRDGRASLAARGSQARAARDRALRGRRARRLLSLPHGRGRACSAHEGAPGHAHPLGELDARARAASTLPHLGRRRARAARRLRLPPRRARARDARLVRSRGRCAASTCGSARRARSRSSAPSTRPSHAQRWLRSNPTRWLPSGRRTTCRCLPAKGLVDGKPAVYVCERFACRAPVTDPSDLAVLTSQAKLANLANMVVVNMHEAKTRLSELVRLVEAGEKVVLARNGTPVVELVAAAPPKKREGGFWKGQGLDLSGLRRADARVREAVLRDVRLLLDTHVAIWFFDAPALARGRREGGDRGSRAIAPICRRRVSGSRQSSSPSGASRCPKRLMSVPLEQASKSSQ